MQAVPVWRTLTHHFPCAADNTHVFRDIKRVSSRKVLELDPSGRKVIEVRGAAPACWRAERLGSRACGGCGAPASESSAAGRRWSRWGRAGSCGAARSLPRC